MALGAADGRGMRRAVVERGRIFAGASLDALLVAAGVTRESLVDRPGLRFIRQRLERSGDRQYFIDYTGAAPLDDWIPLATRAAAVELMDPMTGRIGMAELRHDAHGSPEVRLQLQPGESYILRTSGRAAEGPAWGYRTTLGGAVPLVGTWAVSFIDGGPATPAAFQSDTLAAWTGRGDEEADRFAGTARYTLRFDAPSSARSFLLELGRVAESARVRLNGRELGTLVARPFQVETGALKPTGNVLEVDVTNLSANRVRDLDRRHVAWKIFRDINFVGLDYKPFDASEWPVRTSGLIGPVTVTALSDGGRR
ncbi:MAG: hypothetical protein NVS1B4_11560 [Gemmatimonadaceae bacterium]